MPPHFFFRKTARSGNNSSSSSGGVSPMEGGSQCMEPYTVMTLASQKLRATQGIGPSVVSQQARRDACYKDLRYTKFNIEGFSGEKHAVFIPDCMSLTTPILKQICAALDKEMPSLLLSGMSSLCHPARLSNRELRSSPGFSQLVDEALTSIGGEKVARDHDKKLVDIINRVLEKKLTSSLSTIVSAAQRTNVWTYSGPQISNFEVFVQQCVETGESDVFRMVVAHLQDKAYMESKFGHQLLKELFDNSQEMTSEGVSYFQPITLEGSLWNPAINTSNAEFAENGFDYWSFDTFDQKMVTDHPITSWPWPHANLFLLFYRPDPHMGINEVDWQYRTLRRLDQESIPFNSDLLAPMGYVFIGAPLSWGSQMKKTLLRGMMVSRPLVVLDNTANVAKQASLCINAIKKVWERSPLVACRPFLDDAASSHLSSISTSAEIIQALSPSKILQHVRDGFDSSGMDAQDKLILSDIVGILDLAKRRPNAFREMICVVDPLVDNAVNSAVLMSAFTSHQKVLQDVCVSSVHRSLVLKAWGLHLKFTRTEEQLRRLLTTTAVLMAFALVLSTALAMFMVWEHVQERRVLGQRSERALRVVTVALPISAALLMIVQNNFQVSRRWGDAHMAASRVVMEIYQFLGSVGPYASGQSTNQKRFLRRLRNLARRFSTSLSMEEELMSNADQVFRDHPEVLQQHINSTLYGIRPPFFTGNCFRIFMGSFTWTALLYHEPVDMAAPVSTEMYLEIRMTPLKSYYSQTLYSLFRLRLILQSALLFLLTVTCVLAGLQVPSAIPVTVELAAFVVRALQCLAPSEVFTAINNALDMLSSFELKWRGSNIRENRSQLTKVHFITTLEKMALNVAGSFSRAALLSELVESADNDTDLSESEGKAAEVRIMEQRSRPIFLYATQESGSGFSAVSSETPSRSRTRERP